MAASASKQKGDASAKAEGRMSERGLQGVNSTNSSSFSAFFFYKCTPSYRHPILQAPISKSNLTTIRKESIVMAKSATKASCLAAIIVAINCNGGECTKAGSLSVPTAFSQPRWRQTISATATTATATTKSDPPSAAAALFVSAGKEDDDEKEQALEEFIGEGKPLELESLRGQQSNFMGLEPLSEGEDPFDQGIPLVTGTIVLLVSTWLTLAPFFIGDADLPPPPGV